MCSLGQKLVGIASADDSNDVEAELLRLMANRL